MYIGTQSVARNDSDYEVWAQLGIKHITASPSLPWNEWTVEKLSSFREKINSFGIELDMISLPLTPQSIDSDHAKSGTRNILYGKSTLPKATEFSSTV